jgi:hypothetical protein
LHQTVGFKLGNIVDVCTGPLYLSVGRDSIQKHNAYEYRFETNFDEQTRTLGSGISANKHNGSFLGNLYFNERTLMARSTIFALPHVV